MTDELNAPLPDKRNKVRTSITIDPILLRQAQVYSVNPRNGFSSVSHLIEFALQKHLDSIGVSTTTFTVPGGGTNRGQ